MVVEPLQYWLEDTSCLTAAVEQKKVAPLCQYDRVCPGGWEPFGGHCYQFHSTQLAWADAENDCKSKGGHMASIHSEDERVFVYNLSGKANIWVGGSDSTIEVSCLLHLYYFINNINKI